MNAIIRVSLYASVLALITGIATAPVYAEDNLTQNNTATSQQNDQMMRKEDSMKSDMPMTQKPADSMSMSDDQMKKKNMSRNMSSGDNSMSEE